MSGRAGRAPARRLAASVFTSLLIVVPLSHTASATQTYPGTRSQSAPGAAASPAAVEVPTLRTRTSDTYLQNGHDVARVYPGSINYPDGSGHWQPIDDTLIPSSRPGYAYQNRANRYTVYFPATLGSPIRSESGGDWLEFSLAGGSGSGSVSGASDTFAVPGAQLGYTAGNDLLKEQIVLAAPSSPATFVFALNTSPGLTPRQAADGRIDFVEAAGTIPFVFLPPFLQDNSHAPDSFSRAVSLQLAQTPSGPTVTVSADRSWLATPGRPFPVTIDPEVAYYTTSASSTQDCCLVSNADANNTYCGGSNLDIGVNTSWTARTTLQFPLQVVLPATATVLEAKLGLQLYSEANTTNVAIGAYQLTHSWTTAATWNTDDGTHAWATPGGDFVSTAAATNGSVGASLGWSYWYPTQLAQGWVNGAIPNDGVILKEPSESQANNTLYFYSLHATSSSDWPYLELDYTPLLGQRSFYTMAGQSLDDHLDLAVNLADGDLVATAADFSMPGIGLGAGFSRTYNSLHQGVWTDIGSGWVTATGADITLAFLDDGSRLFQGPSGYQIPFLASSGSFVSPPGIDASLVQTASGYTLAFHASGEVLTFDQAGLLLSDADRSGNALSYNYGPEPNQSLLSITDPQRRTTSFTYGTINAPGSGLLITDPAGRFYQYGYDSNNELTSYTDPAGKVTKHAYTNFDLTSITDPTGIITTLTYDSSNRVTALTRAAGTAQAATWTYTYIAGSTVVDDPNKHTTYAYDSSGRVTAVTDPEGHTTQTTWTAGNRVATVQEPSGATTTNSYDGSNNLTKIAYPTGASASWAYANGSFPYLPSSATDTQGNTTSYQYTSQGLPTTVTDALNHTTSTTHNGNGTVASTTDASGHTTSYQYNTLGLLSGVTHAANQTGQLTLAGSDGVTWKDMDAADLSLSLTPTTGCAAVLSGNASLWTNQIGANPDFGIWIAGGSYGAGQLLAWKESGGTAAFGPDAAYVQAIAALASGVAYTVKLQWKANKATSSTIVAGAGAGTTFSPTTLTASCSSATTVSSIAQTRQYDLTGSNGTTWVDMDSSGLALSVTPSSACSAVLSGNADLWTNPAGYNQDLGIFISGAPMAAARCWPGRRQEASPRSPRWPPSCRRWRPSRRGPSTPSSCSGRPTKPIPTPSWPGRVSVPPSRRRG